MSCGASLITKFWLIANSPDIEFYLMTPNTSRSYSDYEFGQITIYDRTPSLVAALWTNPGVLPAPNVKFEVKFILSK